MDEQTEKDAVTFCIWQCAGEQIWQQNPETQPDPNNDDDGLHFFGQYIFSDASEWFAWASIYYEFYYELQEEAWDAATRLYETSEVTRSMVEDLNPNRDYDTILDECIVNGLLPE